ncbi:MAG: endolytic transglycosylase MltG [Candidatus Desulfofervidaceae bacterium]|nr:endolytic transglycosylase MltG [Candidatus Desulfofervidaceae bacterium]
MFSHLDRSKISLILLFSLWLSCNVFFICWDYITSPLNKSGVIFIQPGWSFKKTVAELQHHGLIKFPHIFLVWGVIKGATSKIKPGEYVISPELSPNALLQHLCTGQGVIHYKLTIPEGATIKEIAKILAKRQLIPRDEFIKWAFNPDFAHYLGINAPSVEGYLFPTTYFLQKGLRARDIIRIMVNEFNQVYKKYANKTTLSRHQVVTLASIVERETAVKEEKPLIASVFLNRLKLDMRLQADPTVIYALPVFDGNLTKEDLNFPSPYNTYIVKGLPPTPICSPGEESIRAVVEAPQTPFLYFVSMGNGRHYFSTNLKEHRRAIRKYQRHKTRSKISN